MLGVGALEQMKVQANPEGHLESRADDFGSGAGAQASDLLGQHVSLPGEPLQLPPDPLQFVFELF
jgi:hypothetical protein